MVLILLTVDWTSQECHAGEFAEAEQSEKGGTENYTVNHHVIHARSSRDEKHRAIRTGQSIPQSRKENENLPTPLSIQGLKRQLTGAGQFLDGLCRRVNTASLPAGRTQATLNMGKYPHLVRYIDETLLPEDFGMHCRDGQRAKRIQILGFSIKSNKT